MVEGNVLHLIRPDLPQRCPPGFTTTLFGSASSFDCVPCPEGSYYHPINEYCVGISGFSGLELPEEFRYFAHTSPDIAFGMRWMNVDLL